MKPHKPNHLLKEVLGGDELTDFRQVSLELGLSAIRRQRRQRQGTRAGALMLLSLLVTFAVLSRRTPLDSSPQLASTNPTTSAAIAMMTDSREARAITDEELFALFPNRPRALVGEPGKQQLVFLNGAAKSRHR